MMDGDRRVKLFAVASVWLLAVAVAVLLSVPPARGYEVSLYRSLPTAFWVLVVASLVAAQAGLLTRAFDPEAGGRLWVVLLASMVATAVLLVSLPYVRGYPIYGRADVLTHVGFIRGIHTFGTGSLPELYPVDIYPNIHMLVLSLWYATGVDPLHVINAISPFVTVVSIGGLYLLLEEVLRDRRRAIAAAAVAALPIGLTAHVNTAPYAQSVLLVPLVFYLFLRGQRTGSVPMRAALVVSLVSLVLYHPLTAFFVLFVFAAYALVGRLGFAHDPASGPAVAGYVTVSAFATWYLQFAGIVFKFRDTFERLVSSEGGTSTLGSISSTVSDTSPELVDLVRIAAFTYGISALLLGLAGLYTLYATYRYVRGHRELMRGAIAVVVSAMAFGALSAVLFVGSFPLDFGRPLLFARYLAVVPAGLALAGIWGRTDRDTRSDLLLAARRGSVVAAIVLVTVLTVFGLHFAPIASLENAQTTRMELDGTAWLFETYEPERDVATLGVSAQRHHDAHFGVWTDLPLGALADPGIPAHFNYTDHATLGESYEADTYLAITELGRVLYPAKFPGYEPLWAFQPEDFERLEHDSTVARVYDNGEFDLYVVSGTRSESDPAAVSATGAGLGNATG